MRAYEVKQFVKDHGVAAFVEAFSDGLDGRNMPNGVPLDPFRMSFTHLWEALVGSVDSSTSLYQQVSEAGALDHTGFPTVAEKLLSTVMIKGYETRRMVADLLVPESMSPKTLTERIPGFTAISSPKLITPGEEYPLADFTDKFAAYEQALHNKKEGVEIALTEEVVRFDQTGMILRHAQNVGMTIQTERERRTVRGILGIGLDTGTAQNGVYFPNGTDTALYRASENNLRTDAAPIYNHPGAIANSKLVDYTDIQEVLTVHAQNIKDDRQLGTTRPIAWMPNAMLIPVSLVSTTANIFNSTGIQVLTPRTTAATDPEVRTTSPNPVVGMFTAFGSGVPVPVASVFADEVSSTAWVVYDRQSTFVRVNIFPFQVFRSPVGYGWNRDILMSVRAREWSRIVAIDHKLSLRNDGA